MTEKKLKFGIQNGLNVARAGYSEDQILTACILADKTGYDSIFYMDHTNVPQLHTSITNQYSMIDSKKQWKNLVLIN